MNKELKTLLIDKLGDVLNNQNFYVADLGSNYCVYHRRNDDYIEIIQWTEDKYKKYITVSASIAFLDTIEEKSNINYRWFKEFNNGDLCKIYVDDCLNKYFLKGNFGERFYFTDVYLALGRGIVGIGQKEKKPLGIRLKKYSSSTYQDICDLIIKRLPRVFEWLRKQQTTTRCQCPCCGYYTLNSRNMYDICPVCYWEDEPIEDPNEFDDCNGISLNEARKNYIRFGYSNKIDRLLVRKPRKKEMFCNRYIHAYINLLDLYTNIDFPKKDITKEVKKGIKGKFNNLYDCVTYLNYNKEYAIRFNDDMKAEEFDNVFETLIKDLGEPDFFNEWEGYIWKRRGYVIALGLVSLNYNYEVPMICVKRSASIFNSNLDYKKYIEIANSIREPLINRGVNPQRITYYKIGYFKEFGFSVYIRTLSKFISINYKNTKLSINITPVAHELNNEILKNQDRFNKEIKIVNDLELKSKLEELLEDTKKYHGLLKK